MFRSLVSPVEVARARPVTKNRGFTLIELMVVLAIAVIVMGTGVPFVYRIWKKEPFRQSINQIVEVCSNARARAILSGQMTEVVFHPRERRLQVEGGGSAPARPTAGMDLANIPSDSGLAASIPEEVIVEMLDVNLSEYKDSEMARVRFYPNGTCDELTIVLRSEKNEFRKITLEVTTALANVGDLR
jgi:prepilin-type N-terminal cleavage/methylation domain-containing protein